MKNILSEKKLKNIWQNIKYLHKDIGSTVFLYSIFITLALSIFAFWYVTPRVLLAPFVVFIVQYYITTRNSLYDRIKIWEQRLADDIPRICEYMENHKKEVTIMDALKIFRAKIFVQSIQEKNYFIVFTYRKEFTNIIESLESIYDTASGRFDKNDINLAIQEINQYYFSIVKNMAQIF